MNKYTLIAFFFLLPVVLGAQTFTATDGSVIVFNLPVSGLAATIDTQGLVSKTCACTPPTP